MPAGVLGLIFEYGKATFQRSPVESYASKRRNPIEFQEGLRRQVRMTERRGG